MAGFRSRFLAGEAGSKEVAVAINSGKKCTSQSGLSLAELLVIVSIVAVVAGFSIPSFSRVIDNTRLKGAAQQLGSLYQDARIRAAQDNASYEVLVSPPGTNPAQACIDLDGDGKCGPAEPVTVFSPQVAFNNGVPVTLGASTLGFDPLTTGQSSMVDGNNVPTPGLAWNSRGVPCQRQDVAAPCSGINGWVQYVQLARGNGDFLYGAVTVSPTGRVKTWTYISSGNGNGSWF